MKQNFITLLIILIVLCLAFGIYKIRKILKNSVTNNILEEQISEPNANELDEIIDSLFPNGINKQHNGKERKLYSFFISEKRITKHFIPEPKGKILLFRDNFFKESSSFISYKLKDFWKEKLSNLDSYYEFNTVEELSNITENDTIIIQTTTYSDNFVLFYNQCMHLITSIWLNIIVLASYDSTDLSMVEQYGSYIDNFLSTSLENGATIRILYTDGFEQLYEYSIK